MNGLRFINLGASGVIVETQPVDYQQARARHLAFQLFVDSLRDAPAGACLILRLIADGIALHLSTLQAILSVGRARLYRNEGAFELQLEMGDGWRDRRVLSTACVEAIRLNAGIFVKRADALWAEKSLCSLDVYSGRSSKLSAVIADAQAWWFGYLGGPLFAHVSRLRPWQPLDRVARARMAGNRPQYQDVNPRNPGIDRMRQGFNSCFVQTNDFSMLERVKKGIGKIALGNCSNESGRQQMLDMLEDEFPAAVHAGRAQALILAGTSFLLTHGGIRGGLLARRSISDYFGPAIMVLATDLAKTGVDHRSGEDWLVGYRTILASVVQSQRPKLAAFLEAFHLFLLLLGIDPLPFRILNENLARPPAAAVITDHELKLSLAFVRSYAESERIAAQASICLLVAYEVELRAYEPWCIRLIDVHLDGSPYLVIYPRLRDGIGKSRSLRRTADLKGRALLKLLSAFKSLRLQQDHADEEEDLLFGEPGVLDVRHQQDKTMRLLNEALVWATGNRNASFYDLRHTVFSREVERALGDMSSVTSDSASLFQVSAGGGHAGPGSTWAYVHWFEEVLAHRSRLARPDSWRQPKPHVLDPALFPDICFGVLDDARTVPPPRKICADASKGASSPIPISRRFEIVRRLCKGETTEAIAGHCQIAHSVVLRSIYSLALAMVDADMVDEDMLVTVSRQVHAIRLHRTWVAAAAHEKLRLVQAALDRMGTNAQDGTTWELWLAWLRCHDGSDLCLERARQASVVLDFLLKAGVPRRHLAVTAPKEAMPLPLHLTERKLARRPCKRRAGTPRYRLALVPMHATAHCARARQVSVRGLHVWLLLLGSVVLEWKSEHA